MIAKERQREESAQNRPKLFGISVVEREKPMEATKWKKLGGIALVTFRQTKDQESQFTQKRIFKQTLRNFEVKSDGLGVYLDYEVLVPNTTQMNTSCFFVDEIFWDG